MWGTVTTCQQLHAQQTEVHRHLFIFSYMRPSKASLEPREERTGGEGRAEDERREDGNGGETDNEKK